MIMWLQIAIPNSQWDQYLFYLSSGVQPKSQGATTTETECKVLLLNQCLLFSLVNFPLPLNVPWSFTEDFWGFFWCTE